jgi:hypothetical protein
MGRLGFEPLISEQSADVRFGAHNGPKSDITSCPKSAPEAVVSEKTVFDPNDA